MFCDFVPFVYNFVRYFRIVILLATGVFATKSAPSLIPIVLSHHTNPQIQKPHTLLVPTSRSKLGFRSPAHSPHFVSGGTTRLLSRLHSPRMLPSYSNDGHGSSEKRPRRSRRGRFGGGDAATFSTVVREETVEKKPCTEYDVAYFHSYAHLGIHEEMIKDRVRTDTYRDAIMRHQNFIQDKVVIDVGCGTGILSIFCARAGAKRVYAVDASDIAIQAKAVVEVNNLSDTITVLHGRVEDVIIDEKVDVIVSEWMGYMLLYESMLGSVITARDRWLKPGGLILPSHATLYMAPITHPDRYSDSVDFWRDVYGINMSPMLQLAKQCAFEEPSVEIITVENVLTWPHVVKHVNCYTVTVEELESVTSNFHFTSMMRAPLHGFAFWFDVEFNVPGISATNNNSQASDASNIDLVNGGIRKKRANPKDNVVLSTAPEDPQTHWQQTVIYFYDPIDVEQDQIIEGSVTLTQSRENQRFMNIHLAYTCGGRSFIKETVMR